MINCPNLYKYNLFKESAMEEATDKKTKIKAEPKVKRVKPDPKPKKSSNKAVSETVHGVNGQGESVLPKPGEEFTLDNGVIVKFNRISLALVRETQATILDPDTKQYNFTDPSTGIETFNLDHPEYKAALRAVAKEREAAGMDIMIAMGIELVAGMPVDEEWERIEKQLLWLERKKKIDLSGLDLKDELDREYAYKKYILGSYRVYYILNSLNGYSLEGIAEQARSFQNDETRDTD